jgi:SynChlorMet cassette protein ScmC
VDIFYPKLTYKNGYPLRLANGQGWYIIATEGVKPWVEKLASIMELKSGEPNGLPKLIFIRRESVAGGSWELISRIKQNTREHLRRNNWKAHDLKLLQLWSHRDRPDVICDIASEEHPELDFIVNISRMWLSLHPIYQRAMQLGGLPLHSALVERNGIGVLVAAPGSTGKSTCCRRLPPPWYALCDDETFIVRGDKGRYFGHPFPTWSDYIERRSDRTWNVQRHIPVSAIFFLEQAKFDEVIPIGQGQTTVSIFRLALEKFSRSWISLDVDEQRANQKKLFDNACGLAKTIPAFKLRVSLNGQFWEKIEKVLE